MVRSTASSLWEMSKVTQHNAMKAPRRYDVQGSDTTMLPKAAASLGQKRTVKPN